MSMRKGIIPTDQLLDRSPDPEYIQEWTERLAVKQTSEQLSRNSNETSLVLFYLCGEWLALPTSRIHEVANIRTIHPIPHRSNEILLGFVNLKGQLRLCFSLNNLLQLTSNHGYDPTTPIAYQRLMAIQKDEQHWVFPVHDVFGIIHYDLDKLEISANFSTPNYLKGIIKWENLRVSYIDDERLFYGLRTELGGF